MQNETPYPMGVPQGNDRRAVFGSLTPPIGYGVFLCASCARTVSNDMRSL